MKRDYPTITITDQGVPFIKGGQTWMYKNNIEYLDDKIPNGSLIDIITKQGEYLGTGFLSKQSHITVRILSYNRDEILDEDFFKQRLLAAYNYRKEVEPHNLDNCRLVYGEGDKLPGLTVDRYNDILVIQISSYGLEKIKDEIYQLLVTILNDDQQVINGIYERNDINVRLKEGLDVYKGFYQNKSFKTTTIINENDIKINVDVENGQKTGYFLDQKSNRVLVRKMAKDQVVLDCFSHTGGFALNAAYGKAKHVDAVDVSKTALNQGYQNAKLNHLEDKISFIQDDVFDFLDKCEVGKYDIIILDPPAFTKSRRTIDHAYNGYKRINTKAMKLLNDGGYLVTCSCSRFMEKENFERMIEDSKNEAHVSLELVSYTIQNKDHPVLDSMQETTYLKFYIYKIKKGVSNGK